MCVSFACCLQPIDYLVCVSLCPSLFAHFSFCVKIKISHAHSLILSLCVYFSYSFFDSLSASMRLLLTHSVSLCLARSAAYPDCLCVAGYGVSVLLQCLTEKSFLYLIMSVLLERRVILIAEDPGVLSAAVLALVTLVSANTVLIAFTGDVGECQWCCAVLATSVRCAGNISTLY